MKKITMILSAGTLMLALTACSNTAVIETGQSIQSEDGIERAEAEPLIEADTGSVIGEMDDNLMDSADLDEAFEDYALIETAKERDEVPSSKALEIESDIQTKTVSGGSSDPDVALRAVGIRQDQEDTKLIDVQLSQGETVMAEPVITVTAANETSTSVTSENVQQYADNTYVIAGKQDNLPQCVTNNCASNTENYSRVYNTGNYTDGTEDDIRISNTENCIKNVGSAGRICDIGDCSGYNENCANRSGVYVISAGNCNGNSGISIGNCGDNSSAGNGNGNNNLISGLCQTYGLNSCGSNGSVYEFDCGINNGCGYSYYIR